MKINYNSYIVFPYTIGWLKKTYSKNVLDAFGERLAFLYQNGFILQDNSFEQIKEQMELFNNFEEYADFEDLKKCFNFKQNQKPTRTGYKIVNSVLETVLKRGSWALTDFVDIKKMGNLYKDKIEQLLVAIDNLFYSDDFEVKKVIKKVFPAKFSELLGDCYDLLEEEKNNILLVKFQKLYTALMEVKKTVNRSLLLVADKGKVSVVGNVNDELYGSSGYYLPNTAELKCVNGSAVFELKTLCSTTPDEELYYKMIVLAKDFFMNGGKSKNLNAFIKGDKSKMPKVRKILTSICFNGILTLLELKHGITLIEDDSLNEERAEKMMREVSAIINYTGYQFA